MLFGFHLVLAALLAQATALGPLPTPSPAPSATPLVAPSAAPTPMNRQILILNDGNNPIFSLHIGGGPDLLGFDQVIDVSEAQEVDITLDPSACRYDVEATYRNGHVELQHNVNLCTTQRITFRY